MVEFDTDEYIIAAVAGVGSYFAHDYAHQVLGASEIASVGAAMAALGFVGTLITVAALD